MSASLASLLPSQPSFRVLQNPGQSTDKARGDWIAKTDHLIIILPESPAASLWRQVPEGNALRSLGQKRKLKRKPLRTRLQNAAGTGIVLGQLSCSDKGAKRPSSFDLLGYAGMLAAEALADNPATVAIMAIGFTSAIETDVLKALLLALSAHNFALPAFQSNKTNPSRLKTVRIVGASQKIELERTLAEANGLNLARWLTALPPNKLNASSYRKLLALLSKQHGWQMDFLDEAKLKRAGAGAFLAVSQGNSTKDAGIVRLRYRPKNAPKGTRARPKLALVGKGIIFDTGGTNLKPFKAMLDMHIDMAGSAVAVATLEVLTTLKLPFAIDCWLAITENRIGNTAYKSRDIVTASNGVTIEVIHTDAEGRMVLADTLALAGKQKPAAMIDFATLTGSCIQALTERYSGVLTNRPQLNNLLIETGQSCGERVWPFPMDNDFDEDIKSSVADVLQCAPAGGGDHIQAARFLQRFVPKQSAWVHVDLSAATRKSGLAQVPSEITGFGVRFATSLIIDNLDQLLNAAKAQQA